MNKEIVTRREAARRFRDVIDPELGVNIVDLGLIYQIYFRGDTLVVEFTTTTPGCPMRRYLHQQVENVVSQIELVDDYEVNMTLNPEWSVEMIKEGVEFFAVPPPPRE